MKTVHITHNFREEDLLRQSPGEKGIWRDYKFHISQELPDEVDFWIVCNYLPEAQQIKVPAKHTILWIGEPESVQKYDNEFINQFSAVITCQPGVKHHNVIFGQLGLPWFVEKSYDQLKEINIVPKTKNISIVASNKQFTAGHRLRYNLAMDLKKHFGDNIDLFGRGIREVKDKWDAIADYRFTIAIENSTYPHYFTEKLNDCYLSYTVPLYYGCPNIFSYFNPASLVGININDTESVKEIISTILENPEEQYRKFLPKLRQAKPKVLNDYNFFNVLSNILDQLPEDEKTDMTLYPEVKFLQDREQREALLPPPPPRNIKSKVKSILKLKK